MIKLPHYFLLLPKDNHDLDFVDCFGYWCGKPMIKKLKIVATIKNDAPQFQIVSQFNDTKFKQSPLSFRDMYLVWDESPICPISQNGDSLIMSGVTIEDVIGAHESKQQKDMVNLTKQVLQLHPIMKDNNPHIHIGATPTTQPAAKNDY